jgi:CHASE2 domain-containing sensor protein
VRRSLPVLLFGLCLSAFLGHSGCLARYDDAALDSYLLLRSPRPVEGIVIVEITERDYRLTFGAKSPLDSAVLADLIRAIQSGRPSLVVVDIDTSAPDNVAALASLTCDPRLVWGQDAVVSDGGVEPVPFPAGARTAGRCASGLALFPQDVDGVVRRYRRVVRTADGRRLPTLPFEAARLATAENGGQHDLSEDDLVLNFSGDRYAFPSFTAAQVLAGAKGPGWTTSGPFAKRIVVLGGTYRAARDEYTTPVGRMAGVHLVAHALASDLYHGGIREAREWSKLAVELLVGFLVVFLHYRLRPAIAMFLSVFALPFGALVGSWVVFSSLGYWVAFTPLVACVLADQVVGHLRRYGDLTRAFRLLQAEHEKLRSSVSASTEPEPPAESVVLEEGQSGDSREEQSPAG